LAQILKLIVMKRFLFSSFLTGMFFMVFQFGAFAQPGTLDVSFVPPTGNNAINNWVEVTALQADGKILIGGSFENFIGPDTKGIARLNADGSIDNTFDPAISGYVTCIKVQADGKILVSGDDFQENNKPMYRLNADGSIDNTFDFPTSLNASFSPSFDITSNGKLIVSFMVGSANYIRRLNTDGTVDNTFTQIGDGWFQSTIRTVKVLPNDKIFVGGNFSHIGGFQAYKRLVLLNANGTPDNDFATNFVIDNGAVNAVDVQQDGKVILVGEFTTINGFGRNFIARLNSDGTLDGGTVDNIFGSGFTGGTVADIKVLANGKILIVGWFTQYKGETANRIIALNSDGSVDETYDFGTGLTLAGRHISIQPDGKIIVGGNFGQFNGVNRVKIVRLNGECLVNANVSVSGITLTSAQSGATYQWIDCNNSNAPIDGETSQSYTPDESGDYAVVITIGNCEETSACVSVDLEACSVDASVTVSNSVLTATQNGATYQWIDCDNGNAPISGATSQSFIPTSNGNYAVIVTEGNCEETSACQAITTLLIHDADQKSLTLYPNPATNVIYIANGLIGSSLVVTDLSGRIVYNATLSSDLEMISTENWSNGLYLIQTELNGVSNQTKVVVSK
jgi:uncharacterized delta-60 repeat protein